MHPFDDRGRRAGNSERREMSRQGIRAKYACGIADHIRRPSKIAISIRRMRVTAYRCTSSDVGRGGHCGTSDGERRRGLKRSARMEQRKSKSGISANRMPSILLWRIVRKAEIYPFCFLRSLRSISGDYIARALEEELSDWRDARDSRRGTSPARRTQFGEISPHISFVESTIVAPHYSLNAYVDRLGYHVGDWHFPNGIASNRRRKYGIRSVVLFNYAKEASEWRTECAPPTDVDREMISAAGHAKTKAEIDLFISSTKTCRGVLSPERTIGCRGKTARK